MSRNVDWKDHVMFDGSFALPNYLYAVINDLMKVSLDMGTMVSNDPAKLRAFKEQTKKTFKDRWLEIARVFESFDILVPCSCNPKDYCTLCGGSRYQPVDALSPDKMREVSTVVSTDDFSLQIKLQEGLDKALAEYKELLKTRGESNI